MQKKSLENVLYSTIGIIVMVAILIAFNVITATFRERVDLTKEKAYTLSDGTRAVLRKLGSPVRVRFYCTQSETASPYSVLLKSYAGKVEDLLEEYKQTAHGNVIIEKYDPQPDSDAEDSARLDGIEPQTLPGGEKFYLGLAISKGLEDKQAIPVLSPDRERQLEYDISRAISRVVTPEKAVVGVMSPLPVFGMPSNPMMAQMGRQGQEPWALITELKSDFSLKRVEMNADKIDDDIRVLLVIHPREISEAAQYAIDQFILRGGKLIAFLDAQSLVDSRGQNPMMGQMPGGGSSLDKLLKAWGLQFDTSKVVADRTFKMELGEQGDTSQQRPAWLALTPEGINSNDIATAELDNIWMFSAGAFTGTPPPGLQETVLLRSTRDSQLVEGMLANFSGDGILKDFKPSGVEYALAVRLTGRFKTAFPEGKPQEKKEDGSTNAVTGAAPAARPDGSLKESRQDTAVVLVGDADMIYDSYTLRRMNSPFGTLAMPMNANLNFAQNLVEQLSGDDNLIAVRSRAILNRPFTRVKKMEAEAEAEYLARIKELEESRDQAVARLTELQSQKSQNQRYILSHEQQAEIDNLRKKEAETSRELRRVNKDLRRSVVSLQRRIEWLNIASMPLAVCLAGVGLAIYKRKRTSAK
ncbi:MAG TPA: Gldg family protein [Verrucomicrobiae bacterium]|nr:Gldg family protein [Verrucomicrobiae bacterium]